MSRVVFRLTLLGVGTILLCAGSSICAAAGDDGANPVIWSKEQAKITALSIHDGGVEGYSKIAAFVQGREIYSSENGYLDNSISVIWQRKAGSSAGPEVVVTGNTGGSACGSDIISLDQATTAVPPQVVHTCFIDQPKIEDSFGQPAFDVVIPAYSCSQDMADVPMADLKLRWNGKMFDLDVPEMVTPKPSGEGLAKLQSTINAELTAAGNADYTLTSGGEGMAFPQTCQTLLNLIFSGHADIARNLLFETWPVGRKGKEFFWQRLSSEVVVDEHWKQLRVDRIPQTGIVTASAKKS